jgi:hypothetical protein
MRPAAKGHRRIPPGDRRHTGSLPGRCTCSTRGRLRRARPHLPTGLLTGRAATPQMPRPQGRRASALGSSLEASSALPVMERSAADRPQEEAREAPALSLAPQHKVSPVRSRLRGRRGDRPRLVADPLPTDGQRDAGMAVSRAGWTGVGRRSGAEAGPGAPVIIIRRFSEVRLVADLHLEEGWDGNCDVKGDLCFPGQAVEQPVEGAGDAAAQIGECFNGRSHDRLIWVNCELRRRPTGRFSGRHPKGRNTVERSRSCRLRAVS